MNFKTITFYLTTLLIVLISLMAGFNNIMRTEMAVQNMQAIHLPIYMATILGAGKILGVIGIIQRVNPKLNDLAYAGFLFLFLGAVASHLLNGDDFTHVIVPAVFVVLTIISYKLKDARAKL